MPAQLRRLVAVVVVMTTLLSYPGIGLAKQTKQTKQTVKSVSQTTKNGSTTQKNKNTVVANNKNTPTATKAKTVSSVAPIVTTVAPVATNVVPAPSSQPGVAQVMSQQSVVLIPQANPNTPEIKVVANLNFGSTSTVANGQTFDYKNVDLSGSAYAVIRMYNIGSADLHLSQVPSISGPDAADFSITGVLPALLITPSTRQFFFVTFKPSSLGVKNATLTINSDDPNQSPYIIPLTGTGISTQSIVYENAEDGATNRWKAIDDAGLPMTITNVADDVNHGKAIEIAVSNYNKQDFGLTKPNGLYTYWYNNISDMRRLKFDLKTVNDVNIYVLVFNEVNEIKFLAYSFDNPNNGLVNNRYGYIHLDPALKDGQWHTITRDLNADFAALFPGHTIAEVQLFELGSTLARVDNVTLTRDVLSAYQVGGTILDQNNAPIPGVTVTLSPFGEKTTTNAQGFYAFPGIVNGNYTVTPSIAQYDFAPVSRQVTVANGNVTANFTGSVSSESVYEDAEDGSVARWVATGAGGVNSITSVVDGNGGHNRVIEIQNSDYYNYNYTLKAADGVNSWHNTTAETFSFDVKTQGDFRTFVNIITDQGTKYLMYSFSPTEGPFAGRYYGFSLNPSLKDGAWHTVVRDLTADVAVAFPGATILSVEEFIAGGTSMRMDNVKLTTQNLIYSISGTVTDGNSQPLSGVAVTIGAQTISTDQNGLYTFSSVVAGTYTVTPVKFGYTFAPVNTSVTVTNSNQTANFTASVQNTFVYEDAEDGVTSKWQFLGAGAGVNSITNVTDDMAHNKVIEIASTDHINNNYQLGDKVAGVSWNNTTGRTLSFDFKTVDDISVFAEVIVNGQSKYVMYSTNRGTGLVMGRYASLRIDPALKDGQWHTYTRDLTADLQSIFPGDQITSVNSFIFGATSARLDNVTLTNP